MIGAVILAEDITKQKELEQSKNSFLAIASHEMRTPLTVIRGNAELLLQTTEATQGNAEMIKFLSGIQRNSVRLLDIVHDFIDVMHMEEGSVGMDKGVFDPLNMLRDVVSDVTSIAEEKKLYILFEKPKSPIPNIIGDIDKTRQILGNLISNGIHYTTKGGITITVEAVNAQQGKAVKICISDTGAGIPPESQGALFQKFSTVSKTFLHTKEYGSGLGLYISKMFVDAMGGSIWLDKSVPGKGSTFCVLLPAA